MANQKLPIVALVGLTNAGKSSLFNRLIGHQEAIVAREAGTTRDSVIREISDENFSRDSGGKHAEKPFLLIDTAGLKNPEDEFEATIQDQIDDAVANADVILLVKDRTAPATEDDRRFAKNILRSKKPVLLLLNKSDLKESLPLDEFLRLGIREIIETSAEHAQGLRELREKIRENIPEVKAEKTDENLIKVALIGRPNVGKSFLFNTLAGKQQAVVANVAGTTRDLNRVKLKYHGQAIEFIDTAGVRKPGKIEKGIEKFSVLRTTSAIEEADICLLLTEVNDVATALDQKLAGMIEEAGKGLALVVSKWDIALDEETGLAKDEWTRDALAPKIREKFDFVPWAPLIFTSAVTGQNVSKIFELVMTIRENTLREIPTRRLNDTLQKAVVRHPPAGLKNTHPKMRYVIQTDTAPLWFVIHGSSFKFVHWSYKRYLESFFRENLVLDDDRKPVRDAFAGAPMKFSFLDDRQIKDNKIRENKFDKHGREI